MFLDFFILQAHPWMQKISSAPSLLVHDLPGACVRSTDQNPGYFLPISSRASKNDFDQEAIKRMEHFGFPKDIIIFSLLEGKKNSLTTAYYLLTQAISKRGAINNGENVSPQVLQTLH